MLILVLDDGATLLERRLKRGILFGPFLLDVVLGLLDEGVLVIQSHLKPRILLHQLVDVLLKVLVCVVRCLQVLVEFLFQGVVIVFHIDVAFARELQLGFDFGEVRLGVRFLLLHLGFEQLQLGLQLVGLHRLIHIEDALLLVVKALRVGLLSQLVNKLVDLALQLFGIVFEGHDGLVLRRDLRLEVHDLLLRVLRRLLVLQNEATILTVQLVQARYLVDHERELYSLLLEVLLQLAVNCVYSVELFLQCKLFSDDDGGLQPQLLDFVLLVLALLDQLPDLLCVGLRVDEHVLDFVLGVFQLVAVLFQLVVLVLNTLIFSDQKVVFLLDLFHSLLEQVVLGGISFVQFGEVVDVARDGEDKALTLLHDRLLVLDSCLELANQIKIIGCHADGRVVHVDATE